jgi:Kef-type K+ transport system membrane component KefB
MTDIEYLGGRLSSITATAVAAGSSAEFLSLLASLALLIASAKLLGSASRRLGQPAVLGELLAGLLLGPSVLNVFSLPVLALPGLRPMIHNLGQIGVLLLMFGAGLEVELEDLRQSGRPAVMGGILGMITPTLLGLGAGTVLGLPVPDAIFLGITLSATSVSISAQTLLELGRLRTREGIALLGAAVVDDLLVIVMLSLFVTLATGREGGLAGVAAQLLRMLLVLGGVAVLALFALPRLADLGKRLDVSEGMLAMVLAGVLLLAWLMEYVGGVAAITGAFLAGVGLGRSHLKEEIEGGLHRLAYAFFVPLFLVDIGLQADVRTLESRSLLIGAVVLVVAIVSKVLGSGLGAYWGGFSAPQAVRIGLGMVSRGEVGLIVAGVGITEGLLTADLFAVIILTVLITTLITPPLLRWGYAKEEVASGSINWYGRP